MNSKNLCICCSVCQCVRAVICSYSWEVWRQCLPI